MGSSRLAVIDKDGNEQTIYEPYDYQVAWHASTTPNLLALGTRNTGKAIALDTIIPTPDGYRTMEALAVGDRVFDERGNPTRVIWESEPHVDPTGTYRLTFDDGSVVVCGGQHEWLTSSTSEAQWRKVPGSIKTTLEILRTIHCGARHDRNHRVSLGHAWQLPGRNLPIDPYVFGVWLGDGHSSTGQLTSADPEVIQELRRAGYEVYPLAARYLYGISRLAAELRALDAVEYVHPERDTCRACGQDRNMVGRRLCIRCSRQPDVRARHAKAFKGFKRFTGGVLTDKRIPEAYLWASAAQRLALLQGLMDTDGSCDKRQHACEFCNTNENLARGVFHLAVSLGLKPTFAEGRATLKGRDIGPKYRVSWTATLPVFRLTRKLARLPSRCRATQSYRSIMRVDRIGDQRLQCIEVDAPNHLYLVGATAIPTHNSLMLRMDAILRCLMIPNFRALIVRRKMPDLRKSHLFDIPVEMKLLTGDRDHYVSSPQPLARFDNGSTISFAHCNTDADILDYLSSQYGYVGFDELSTFTLEQFLLISAAARAPKDAPYRAVVRAGSNPLGPGSEWMYRWFVEKTVDYADFPDYAPDDFEMQFSRLDQNKSADVAAYTKRLSTLPAHVRRAWLLGEKVVDGAYFMDFHKTTEDGKPWHVIDKLPLWEGKPLFSYDWLGIYRAVDWGYYPDPAVCLWFAILPNHRVIVFKERTWRKTLAADVAKAIKKESEGLRIRETFADPTMLLKAGITKATGYSVGELFEQQGVPLTPSTNDRALYGYAIHDHLNTLIDETPQLQIVAAQDHDRLGCPNLIRTLPLMQTDPNDPRKIADGEDHWVCGLSYLCIGQAPPSRNPTVSAIPRWMRPRRNTRHSVV